MMFETVPIHRQHQQQQQQGEVAAAAAAAAAVAAAFQKKPNDVREEANCHTFRHVS
jgi:hypothetical protein